MDTLKLYDKEFNSRFLLGTALYPSPDIMLASIKAAATELVTVSLRRQNPQEKGGNQFWDLIQSTQCSILPNTAGCHSAKEAITLAQMSRELFNTNWILCQRLLDVGCEVLMPWGAPIGTGRGLMNPYALQTLRERLPDVPLIVDAGIGAPSHAARAMELGFDAVLLNTAVAEAADPVLMAEAFKLAVEAGRKAYLAGTISERQTAKPSTPTLGMPFWHQG